jgi:hypothetical protein
MSINIDMEKNRSISTQEVYDIVNFALNAANDDGNISSFVFSRMLYIALAMTVYSDRFEEIKALVEDSPLNAWDILVDDGTIEKLFADNGNDCDFIADCGQEFFQEQVSYNNSFSGSMNDLAVTLSNSINDFSENLTALASDDRINQVLKIADKWGMNRGE